MTLRVALLCVAAKALLRQPSLRHHRTRVAAAAQDPVLSIPLKEAALANATPEDDVEAMDEELSTLRMNAEMSVLQANAAFYEAFGAADAAKMKELWTDSDDATCVHPGHPVIVGAGPVLNSWRALFMSGGMPPLKATRQKVVLRGEVAWVTCNESAGDEPSTLEALNIFERREGRWRMIHHQAGPIFVSGGQR